MIFIILFALSLVLSLEKRVFESNTESEPETETETEQHSHGDAFNRAPVAARLAIANHFSKVDWNLMAGIAECESGFVLRAHRVVKEAGPGFLPEDSRGPWQVNVLAWPNLAKQFDLYSWDGAAAAARIVKDIQGIGAWKICSERIGVG